MDAPLWVNKMELRPLSLRLPRGTAVRNTHRRGAPGGGQEAGAGNPSSFAVCRGCPGRGLAGANRPPEPGQDDGILTAMEVAELDLRHVELAVLSACETGLGEVAGGEGVLGLQRAFQVAGARSTVTSLWQVPDRATRELMERFYAGLWDRKQPLGKLEALRQAQLWLLREGPARGLTLDAPKGSGPRRAPPFYWAAFVLAGDWR